MNTLENFGPLPLYLAIHVCFVFTLKNFYVIQSSNSNRKKKSIEKVDEDFFLHKSDKRQLTEKMQQCYWLQNSLKAKKHNLYLLYHTNVYLHTQITKSEFLVSFCLPIFLFFFLLLETNLLQLKCCSRFSLNWKIGSERLILDILL